MVIRAGILADIHKKYIIWQLLKALKYLHSAGVLVNQSYLAYRLDLTAILKITDSTACSSLSIHLRIGD